MQIKIKTLTGKVTDFNVEPDETVKDLKVRVTREMKVKGPDANTGLPREGCGLSWCASRSFGCHGGLGLPLWPQMLAAAIRQVEF